MNHSDSGTEHNEHRRKKIKKKKLLKYDYIYIRWIQFIFCCACLVLALYIKPFAAWISTICLIPVSAIFLIITGANVLLSHLVQPLPIRTWVLILFTGFLLFGVCTAVSILGLVRYFYVFTLCAIIFNFITAILFLLDFIYAMMVYRSVKADTEHREETYVDAAVYANIPPPHKRHSSRVGPANEIPMTHGGTFPIGNDQTPISPELKSKTVWSENYSEQCCEDNHLKAPRSERRRSHSSAPATSVIRGQCLRYAIKISPSKSQKSQVTPRVVCVKDEGCQSAQCVSVHTQDLQPIVEDTDISSPNPSFIKIHDKSSKISQLDRNASLRWHEHD